MHIQVNGKKIEVEKHQLDELLVELGYEDAIVATAVNSDFVPIDKRTNCELKDGDSLEILAPMQGG